MSHKKFYTVLIAIFVLTGDVSYAAEGKIGSIARLNSDKIVLQYDKPIKDVYVLYKAGDDEGDLDVLLFLQALRARLAQKGFRVRDTPEEADVLLSLNIKKIKKHYWFGLPTKFGNQRRVVCLSVDTTYETSRGRWNKEFIAHKGYWTFKGDSYFRNTMTNDLARAIVNPLHDYTKEKALISAAGKGDMKAVLGFINEHMNINADNDLGYTPLIAASKNGHSEIVRLLISLNAQINAKDQEGWSALTHAAYNGDKENTALLLENGAYVDTQDYKSITPLDYAVLKGHRPIVGLLLSYNPRVGNALEFAKQEGNKELEMMLSAYAQETNQSLDYDCGYLFGLIKNENMEKVRHLMEHDLAVVDSEDDACKDALIAAAGKGDMPVIELFLNKGIDVNANDKSGDAPLLAAAAAGHQEVVKRFIFEGADLYRFGGSALALAAKNGQKDIVEYLLSESVDVNSRGRSGTAIGETPLGEAARAGRKKVIELLLENGADINSKNKNGKTALMKAALAGKEGIVRLLLSGGADIDQRDDDGNTVSDLVSKVRIRQNIGDIDLRNVADILRKEKVEKSDKRKRLRSIAK